MLRRENAERIGGAPLLRRRDLLRLGACAGALTLPIPALARMAPKDDERTLKLYNLHTGETLKATYWENGTYVPDALRAFDRILRDHDTDAEIEIDPGLLDLINTIESKIGATQGLDVLCGYRSPETNERLIMEGRVHAHNSFHISGQAIDFRVPGRDLRLVRKVAMSLQQGGVGYYPRSHFIHVDTGPVRHW